MKKKSIVLTVLLSITIIVIIITLLISKDQVSEKKLGEKENYIVGRLNMQDISEFEIHSSDYMEYMEFFLFTFSQDNIEYIGFASFYNPELSEPKYSDENFVTFNYDLKALDTPFTIYKSEFSTPARFVGESGSVNEYRYYYGNINDKNIFEIVFNFISNSTHVMPINNEYYSTLTVNNENLKYIRGINSKMDTIHEYTYY